MTKKHSMKTTLKDGTGITIRNGAPEDYERVIAVMPEWWGGKDMTNMILKLFFVHFRDTVLIAERGGELAGFIVGFYSQSIEGMAYIHFAGVHPSLRRVGLARILCEYFYELCLKKGKTVVRSCTSPGNAESLALHRHMGCVIEPGDGEIDGIPVTLHYHRKNNPKIVFRKDL